MFFELPDFVIWSAGLALFLLITQANSLLDLAWRKTKTLSDDGHSKIIYPSFLTQTDCLENLNRRCS